MLSVMRPVLAELILQNCGEPVVVQVRITFEPEVILMGPSEPLALRFTESPDGWGVAGAGFTVTDTEALTALLLHEIVNVSDWVSGLVVRPPDVPMLSVIVPSFVLVILQY